MVRNNRTITRLSLILVICAGLFGGWFAYRNWQPDLANYDAILVSQEIDWVDVVSGIGEEAIQFLLGMTSESP